MLRVESAAGRRGAYAALAAAGDVDEHSAEAHAAASGAVAHAARAR